MGAEAGADVGTAVAGAREAAAAPRASGTIESGAFEPAAGPTAAAGLAAADAERVALRAAGADGGEVDATSKPPDWSARMVTVCIFFGSDDAWAGAAAGIMGAAIEAGGGLFGSDVAVAPTGGAGGTAPVATGAAIPGDAEFCAMIGIVDTTRGAVRGGSILIGCSSRETTLSAELAFATAVCLELLGWESTEFGIILFGPLLALMIGGRVGKTDPPNMAR